MCNSSNNSKSSSTTTNNSYKVAGNINICRATLWASHLRKTPQETLLNFGVWLKRGVEKNLLLRFSWRSAECVPSQPWPTCPYRTPLQKRSWTCLVQDQSVQLQELRKRQHSLRSQQRQQVRLQVLLPPMQSPKAAAPSSSSAGPPVFGPEAMPGFMMEMLRQQREMETGSPGLRIRVLSPWAP